MSADLASDSLLSWGALSWAAVTVAPVSAKASVPRRVAVRDARRVVACVMGMKILNSTEGRMSSAPRGAVPRERGTAPAEVFDQETGSVGKLEYRQHTAEVGVLAQRRMGA